MCVLILEEKKYNYLVSFSIYIILFTLIHILLIIGLWACVATIHESFIFNILLISFLIIIWIILDTIYLVPYILKKQRWTILNKGIMLPLKGYGDKKIGKNDIVSWEKLYAIVIILQTNHIFFILPHPKRKGRYILFSGSLLLFEANKDKVIDIVKKLAGEEKVKIFNTLQEYRCWFKSLDIKLPFIMPI